ncbi:2,3-diaminopropionate biosynthesis protein SbnB [Nocardia gamkensis]|uniref:2,3-diaminopropionate biosynthesis protein SbnB n=1 Tax=Nocardia gamkensis TaxID=352869 RepID=UPI0028160527|nr:2,3-diaminopropionate biosynthesis protein SbnB [Nocardia gamkensis]
MRQKDCIIFDFELVTSSVVSELLRDNVGAVLEIVRNTYVQHRDGLTVNPDSLFLKFPEKKSARIIALPAFIGGDIRAAGIKWISSFPENIDNDVPRASAVLVLNDYETGYPAACLEAAGISAARTAASAALAAKTLRPEGYRESTIAVIGAGVIARTICDHLVAAGCRPQKFLVHDLNPQSGQALVQHLTERLSEQATTTDLDGALAADTVVFATTAATPYVSTAFRPGQLVLNISLRDIAPEVVLGSANILDDIDHCLKANTSPHLAEQLCGSRDFVTGTLADVLVDAIAVPPGKPLIFSPFGMGVLDIAVGSFVYERARSAGRSIRVPEFFAAAGRW